MRARSTAAADAGVIMGHMPTTVTLRHVELVRAGSWAASTGPVTITTDDLDAMVTAAADLDVDRAAIRIGHVDPRFDGEPALGWVENLSRGDGSSDRPRTDALYGDLVEVPSMLGELIPRAFRRRSVEIAWQVRTPAGQEHRAALTGLALLGVAPPAVKGLADVAALYGRTAAAAPTTVYTGQPGAPAATFVTACTIGDDVPADDPADAAIGSALATMTAGLEALTEALAPTIPAPPASTSHNVDDDPAHDPPQEARTMPVDESRIRELLGLEADADVEAELERIAATLPATPEGAEPPAGTEPATPATPAATPAPTATEGGTPTPADPATPAATPELVTLSAGQFAELQAAAQRGAQAAETIDRQRRDGIIATALSEGRIAPADADDWRAQLDANEAGTVTLLSKITPAFPTSALGADNAPDSQAGNEAWDEFDRTVLGIGD